jgi:hypothetical protein
MAKVDSVLDRMREYFDQKGAPVIVQPINKGYSIIHESGEPVARFRPRAGDSNRVEVLWWSHRDKWDHIGDFGGLFMGLEEALGYVLSDPMGVFWKGQNRGITTSSTRTGGKLGLLASLGKLFGAGR